MAKVTVTREKPVDPPIKEIVLALSYDEAVHVKSVIGRVAFGSFIGPEESQQANSDVFYALKLAGIDTALKPALQTRNQ